MATKKLNFDQEGGELEARGHREDVPLTVSQLNWYIKNLLEEAVPKVWIEGEISDLSQPSSGHLYFTLKDDQSQVRAVIWRSTAGRLPFKIKDGLSIVCCGSVEVYPPRGSYQVIINRLQPKGVGPLQLAFQQLHAKLSAEGLFDAGRKKPLPAFPRRVGFVTSPSGAAIHDFLEASRDLWTDFEMTIIPSRVQGELAAQDLVRAIQLAHRIRPKLDLLIVGRGGGSIEDLWCFNEEPVVRAISAASLPVVSAIGHEIDVTLSDLAADARALTPTHAAQLIFPSKLDLKNRLQQIERRMNHCVRARANNMRLRLRGLTERGPLARPHELHLARRQKVDDLEMQAHRAMRNALASRKEKIGSLARASEALSPLNVLARGYSLTHLSGTQRPLQSVSDVVVGDEIETLLARGSLSSVVTRIEQPSAGK